jgi:hypothetical protein
MYEVARPEFTDARIGMAGKRLAQPVVDFRDATSE